MKASADGSALAGRSLGIYPISLGLAVLTCVLTPAYVIRWRFGIFPTTLLEIAILLTVVAFAHANPPDQTWQPGIYDDADFDDVIALIVSWSGATPESFSGALGPLPVTAATIAPAEPHDLPTRLLRPDDTRSPPSS